MPKLPFLGPIQTELSMSDVIFFWFFKKFLKFFHVNFLNFYLSSANVTYLTAFVNEQAKFLESPNYKILHFARAEKTTSIISEFERYQKVIVW